MPICFVRVGDALYTAIDDKKKRSGDASRLRRVRNIIDNGRAAVVVDRWDEDWGQLAYVLVEGRAGVLGPGDERDAALRALRARYPQYETVLGADAPVIRVAIDRAVEWEARAEG